MSLRGRAVIDRLKASVGRYIRLPVPPYHNPSYWEGVYRQLGPDDVFEWGNLQASDLLQYRYRLVTDDGQAIEGSDAVATLDDTLGVRRKSSSYRRISAEYNDTDDAPILMMGCGNSKLGEDMVEAGFSPIIQVDVAGRVVESLAHRCAKYVQSGDMQLIEDDATVLSAFHDNKVLAVIDKGLLDALFCADQYEQCSMVLDAAQRVLRPGGVLAVLSFSSPLYLLARLTEAPASGSDRLYARQQPWASVQVRQLDTIYLYRFQKATENQLRTLERKRSRRPRR